MGIGYVFIATSFIMTLGIFLILARNLSYLDNDYPDAPPVSKLENYTNKLFTILEASWFAWTACMAVFKARAKDFESHKNYIYRHIASGLWVAIQRLILLGAGPQKDAQQVRDLFGNAAYAAVFISTLLGEVAETTRQKFLARSLCQACSHKVLSHEHTYQQSIWLQIHNTQSFAGAIIYWKLLRSLPDYSEETYLFRTETLDRELVVTPARPLLLLLQNSGDRACGKIYLHSSVCMFLKRR